MSVGALKPYSVDSTDADLVTYRISEGRLPNIDPVNMAADMATWLPRRGRGADPVQERPHRENIMSQAANLRA